MAEHTEKAAAPEKGAAKKEGGGGHSFWAKALDEVAADAAEFSADALYRNLNPNVRAALKRRSGLLRMGRVLRFIPGLPHAAEEYIQGFISNFNRLVVTHGQEDEHIEPARDAQQINRTVEIALAVQDLDDDTLDDFEEWWLTGGDDRRNAFIKLVSGANAEQIKRMASRSPVRLERLIAPLREKPAPAHHEEEDRYEELKRRWNAVDDAIARELYSAARWVNRVGNRGKRNRYGIRQPSLRLFVLGLVIVVVTAVILGVTAQLIYKQPASRAASTPAKGAQR